MKNVPTTRRPSRLGRAGLFLALAAALAILLAACGSSGSSSDPAAGQPGSSSGSSQGGAVAFAQCVRSHGVPDFPDPQNGHFLISAADQDNPNFKPAVQACQHLLGAGGATNGGSNNTALLNFAHCMQTHGVPQFPDPTANGAIGLPQGVDPNSPQFQRAWQECQSNLPGNLQGQQP
ncbi:MAG TPA: hypothetical protein VIX15_15915 [Streptosporangiaceae bacterium]